MGKRDARVDAYIAKSADLAKPALSHIRDLMHTACPPAEETAFSYDEIAEAYAAGVDSAPYNALYERPATLSLLPDVAGSHILDAGCGSGFYAEQLVKRGARVTAIDGSAAMTHYAEQRLRALGMLDNTAASSAGASIHVADLGGPFPFLADASVDGILAALALHYLRDWTPTLEEFRRVLKPGGWFLMSTHHPATEAARFKTRNYFETEQIDDYWSWVGKVRFFRRPLTSITGALTEAGFVIERLVEAKPTDAFRIAEPESYDRLMTTPDFIHFLARYEHALRTR